MESREEKLGRSPVPRVSDPCSGAQCSSTGIPCSGAHRRSHRIGKRVNDHWILVGNGLGSVCGISGLGYRRWWFDLAHESARD